MTKICSRGLKSALIWRILNLCHKEIKYNIMKIIWVAVRGDRVFETNENFEYIENIFKNNKKTFSQNAAQIGRNEYKE